MRFIIYGAGGIGGTIGARLFRSGFDVVLIARGAHLDAIQTKGLRFVAPTAQEVLRIPAVSHPKLAGLGEGDVVFLCMKSQHTQNALQDLVASAGDDLPVICCQNGVANERMALRRFKNVYGMVVQLPTQHLEPGEVVTFAEDRAGVLDAGRFQSGIDDTITEVTSALEASGFGARPDPNIMRHKYAKLLNNLNNAVQAATGETSKVIARLLREEALACYLAAGIDCATREETRERRAYGVKTAAVSGYDRLGGSSAQSILRGTGDIESDYLNGEIVLLGRLHGVPVPANTALQRLGNLMAQSGLKMGAFTLQDVEHLIANES